MPSVVSSAFIPGRVLQPLNSVSQAISPGDPPQFIVAVTNAFNEPVDLTGYELVWKVYDNITQNSREFLPLAGIETISLVDGVVALDIPEDVLKSPNGYFHRLHGRAPGGKWHALAEGRIDVRAPAMNYSGPGGF